MQSDKVADESLAKSRSDTDSMRFRKRESMPVILENDKLLTSQKKIRAQTKRQLLESKWSQRRVMYEAATTKTTGYLVRRFHSKNISLLMPHIQ